MSLRGKVALVAGATRGAGRGIAVELGAAGATVYVTGRTTRSQRSEMNRPETIEETAALRCRSTISCPTRCGRWWPVSKASKAPCMSW
jgi:NAD(P)-dependent dehydrogenase (short-subunit alcohol dehydrogenase family)